MSQIPDKKKIETPAVVIKKLGAPAPKAPETAKSIEAKPTKAVAVQSNLSRHHALSMTTMLAPKALNQVASETWEAAKKDPIVAEMIAKGEIEEVGKPTSKPEEKESKK